MKVLVVLRHEASLDIVARYLETQGIDPISVTLDPVEYPGQVGPSVEKIKSALSAGVDAVILGTKVYDSIKLDRGDPPQKLIEFLYLLKEFGINQTPVCLTHLSDMPENLAERIMNTGMNIRWVENDNLKNDRMNNLGPLLLSVLKK